jgi:hypothetical protein
LLSPLPRRSRPNTLDFPEQCAWRNVRELVRIEHEAGRLHGDISIYPGDDTDEGRAIAAGVDLSEVWLARRSAWCSPQPEVRVPPIAPCEAAVRCGAFQTLLKSQGASGTGTGSTGPNLNLMLSRRHGIRSGYVPGAALLRAETAAAAAD